jgi:hypothetical protein
MGIRYFHVVGLYLKLGEGEATTSAHTTVVLDGRAAHDWPQTIDGARSDFGGLLVTSVATAELAPRLEEGGMSELTVICTTGATTLKSVGMRGELPGQSALGHGVASPCGSLRDVSRASTGLGMCEWVICLTVVLDLLVVLDRLDIIC